MEFDLALDFEEAKRALRVDLISWGIANIVFLLLLGGKMFFTDLGWDCEFLSKLICALAMFLILLIPSGILCFGFRFVFTKIRTFIIGYGSWAAILAALLFAVVVVISGMIYFPYRIIKDSIEFHKAKVALNNYVVA